MSTTSTGLDDLVLDLAHVEIRTRDLNAMVAFYTETVGFVVTDRSSGTGAMVFLSRSPDEHHQIVLAATTDDVVTGVDHVAFRVSGLDVLQDLWRRFRPDAAEAVSHGNSWSVYAKDPDGNRLEFFVDTPWHVDQPARWPIDLDQSIDDIRQATLDRVRTHPGFKERSSWETAHRRRLDG